MPKVIDEAALFAAAARVFVREGYAGTTTKAIADAAGVNEATLFRRYGSKAALLERALDRQWIDVPLANVGYSGDVVADLISIVEAYLATNRLHGPIVPVLLVELTRSPELRGAFRHARENMGRVAEILGRHQAEGNLREESPLDATRALLGPIIVDEMFRRAGIGAPPPRPDVPSHVEAFLYGRAPRG